MSRRKKMCECEEKCESGGGLIVAQKIRRTRPFGDFSGLYGGHYFFILNFNFYIF